MHTNQNTMKNSQQKLCHFTRLHMYTQSPWLSFHFDSFRFVVGFCSSLVSSSHHITQRLLLLLPLVRSSLCSVHRLWPALWIAGCKERARRTFPSLLTHILFMRSRFFFYIHIVRTGCGRANLSWVDYEALLNRIRAENGGVQVDFDAII